MPGIRMIKSLLQAPELSVVAREPDLRRDRNPEVTVLFREYEAALYGRTHRLFFGLFAVQWVIAIVATYIASHRIAGQLEPHVLVAILGGAILIAPAAALMAWAPNLAATRHMVAISQAGFSALIIYLSNGRIESHFHVFGSLAFLALYRDWRILPTASLVVLLHHAVGGAFYPEITYCSPTASILRTYEHVGWVLFEDSVLIWACVTSRREMWIICEREDENRRLLSMTEARLEERTSAYNRIEERSTALFRTLPIGIFECARTGELLLANETLLRTLGLFSENPGELEIKGGLMLSPADTQTLWKLLDAHNEVRGYETTLERADGTLVQVVINARLKRNHEAGTESCEGSAEDVTDRKVAEREMERLNQQLMAASRQVGMAEAATGVLHNVGNVLTSVNLTVHDMQDRLGTSRISHLRRAADLIEQNQAGIATYIASDPTGTQLPSFLINLTKHLEGENQKLREDMTGLAGHFEHIREIIVAQQSSARILGIMEDVRPDTLIEDALRLTAESFERHRIQLKRENGPTSRVRADRHKVLQILVNLLGNAKDALLHLDKAGRKITVTIFQSSPRMVAIAVTDNGVGIAYENLTKIFQHGFTTKKEGHGFGLHSAAIAAQEMRGDLVVTSPGVGHGATFTLFLPVATKEETES